MKSLSHTPSVLRYMDALSQGSWSNVGLEFGSLGKLHSSGFYECTAKIRMCSYQVGSKMGDFRAVSW